MKKYMVITNHSYMLWRFRKELIERLMQDGEVVVCTPFVGHEEDLRAIGCRLIEMNVDRRGINPVTDSRLFASYYKMLKHEQPDMVITYSIKPNIYAGFACRMLKLPYCVNVQGLGTAFQKQPIASVVTLLYKAALKKAKVVFFENKGNAAVFLKRRIILRRQIRVLPGAGINLEDYAYSPYPENDCFHFLYLGRIMKEKGIDELFYAARKLAKKHPDTFVLDLVGFFEDEYKEEVNELEQLGIVKFHGFQEEPVPFFAAADCVVMPSYHEGLSNVLLEAAAIGRPVITSDIPGCRETVNDGESGFLCEVKDKEALFRRMEDMLNLTHDEREEMGQCGRQKMEKSFSKKKVVRMTEHAINNRFL